MPGHVAGGYVSGASPPRNRSHADSSIKQQDSNSGEANKAARGCGGGASPIYSQPQQTTARQRAGRRLPTVRCRSQATCALRWTWNRARRQTDSRRDRLWVEQTCRRMVARTHSRCRSGRHRPRPLSRHCDSAFSHDGQRLL